MGKFQFGIKLLVVGYIMYIYVLHMGTLQGLKASFACTVCVNQTERQKKIHDK